MGLIAPRRLEQRATVILRACGGNPTREALGQMSPRTQTAWDAYHVGWYLMHARDDLHFLRRGYGGAGVDSLKWRYRAYLSKKASARRCIRLAGKCLAQAEAGFAALQPKEIA